MDNVEKALALARIGIKVFPVSVATRSPLISIKSGGSGFYDATSDDFEQIATWFTLDFPDENTTAVGYWTGGSGLFVADLDRGKSNGKDGFKSIAERGLIVNPTFNYSTPSGGEHHVYFTDRIDLTLSKDHEVDGVKLEGVDIRAGGSYAVWWGDEVPESRKVFSSDIPSWMTDSAVVEKFEGEGFSGSVEDWLQAIPDDVLPSGKVRNLIERIPKTDFGHNEMVELAWEIVRMGSERETGIRRALGELREAWLREPYNVPKYRRDLNMAIKGAITKAGRVQNPVPTMMSFANAMKKATDKGVDDELRVLERKTVALVNEVDLARSRKEMFKVAARAGLTPAAALGIVTGSKAFKNSKASIESAWFGDGESFYHDIAEAVEQSEAEEQAKIDREVELVRLVANLSADAQKFTFLSEVEQSLVESKAYEWFGTEYLDWVKGRLKHFNRPYHVASLFAALSVIVSPWGKVPLAGAKPTDCNLYVSVLGDSSTGKTESWEFGTGLIDAYYGIEGSPIIGDINKLSALALHRSLILRDGKPSLVYGDEIQSFFQGLQGSQWQSGILGDISSHYGGNVSPKLTLNDKEISGKRAMTMLTTYLTGIADQTLDAIGINHWTNGFFYRFLWGFGNPRIGGDHDIKMEITPAAYTTQYDDWARELKRIGSLQEIRWGAGRLVQWEEDALARMVLFKEQIDNETKSSALYDSVFVNANGRFSTSILKVATIIAMSEASEKVTLRHALIAISYAGPWHRSMVLAIGETGKEPFEREVEKCLVWIKRNAIRQIGKPAWIQRSQVMRAFKPNEVADRLLRQLTEEGWLVKNQDTYQLSEEEES